jgi:iron(III) transport system substrate-binding protein
MVAAIYDSEAGKTTGLVNRLVGEARAGHPGADVFWSGELFGAMRLAEQGLLEPFDAPSAAEIPQRFRDVQYRWTAMAVRARVLAFDPARTAPDQAPFRWEEIARPEVASHVAIANPLFGTTRGQVAAMFALWGRERGRNFLARLRDGGALILDGNSATVRAVIDGRARFAVTDSDDVWAARRAGAMLDSKMLDMGDGGTFLIPCSVALIKGGTNHEAAKKLVDFLVSADVERMLAQSDSHNIPVRESLRQELNMGWPAESRIEYGKVMEFLDQSDAAARFDPLIAGGHAIFLLLASAAIYLAAIAWPAVALVWSSIVQGAAPRDGFGFSYGQIALLGRTFLLTIAAAILCLPPAVGAGVLAWSRRPHPLIVAILAAGLMCPPMVYSFGWLRLFPLGVAPEIRCVVGWVLWAWPVAAILIGAGWANTGKQAFLAATLSTSPLSAFVRVGLPALRPHVFLAAMLMFVLFFGDYGVPHAFGLRMYATELLAWASESNHTIDVLWPALLPVAITAIALGVILLAIRRCGFYEDEQVGEIEGRTGWRVTAQLFLAVGWLLPLIALSRPLTPTIFAETWRTYRMDLAASMGAAGVAAILIMLLSLGFAATGRWRKALLFGALLFGVLPGPVIDSLLSRLTGEPFRWLYDNWPIMSLLWRVTHG